MSWLLVVGLVLAACGGDPTTELVETDEVAAEEPVETTEPTEPEAAADEPADEVVVDDAPPPASVHAPIGVVYVASGSFEETFGLIQTPEVSVFSTPDVTSYVDAETMIVCPTGEGCTRARREGLELMGMLGGQIVTDMSAFAASVPFSSSSSETIAGRDARCIVPVDAEQLQEYCWDLASGIALRWQVIDEGVPTSVTAIEVFEPTPEDLAPSGPVTDLPEGEVPGMGAGDLDLGDLDLGDLDLGDIDLGDLPGS